MYKNAVVFCILSSEIFIMYWCEKRSPIGQGQAEFQRTKEMEHCSGNMDYYNNAQLSILN